MYLPVHQRASHFEVSLSFFLELPQFLPVFLVPPLTHPLPRSQESSPPLETHFAPTKQQTHARLYTSPLIIAIAIVIVIATIVIIIAVIVIVIATIAIIIAIIVIVTIIAIAIVIVIAIVIYYSYYYIIFIFITIITIII